MLKKDSTKTVKAKPQPGKAKPSNALKTAGANRTTGPKAAARTPTASSRPQGDLQQLIQQRAYELWESEGRPHGRAQTHWMQAQHEIAKGRRSRASAKL